MKAILMFALENAHQRLNIAIKQTQSARKYLLVCSGKGMVLSLALIEYINYFVINCFPFVDHLLSAS